MENGAHASLFFSTDATQWTLALKRIQTHDLRLESPYTPIWDLLYAIESLVNSKMVKISLFTL